MSKTAHTLYISLLSLIVLTVTVMLIYDGRSYYETSMEERFYHEDHQELKPSGVVGHGLGIVGSLLMIIGVSSYMMRKRMKRLSRLGLLKHWLEFHIFLCTLGPIMVLFHTSFKFGGLVAISFWSMVAVFLSGIIGRFIYIQIPRTIEGRELSLQEVKELKTDAGPVNISDTDLNAEIGFLLGGGEYEEKRSLWSKMVNSYFADNAKIRDLKKKLKESGTDKTERSRILKLVKNELSLNRRIGRLQLMQDLFKYWHVAHLPFAIVMLVIMIIHVVVTIIFGYRWIW
jgi:hypothetical protein